MAHAVRPPYSGVGQRTRPAGHGKPPGSAVRSLVERQCELPGARGNPDAMLPGDPSARSPGESRALLPVIGVSGFFITTGPRHIQIPPQMPRRDSVQKAILPATREIYVARTTSSRKLRKTNRTRNSSGGRQARKRCAGCDRTGSLEICGARMVRATAQPADTRDLSRTATT
jgi:hypothetical protein